MDSQTKSLYESGENTLPGNYVCASCSDEVIVIEKADDKLPPCPTCGHTYWLKF